MTPDRVLRWVSAAQGPAILRVVGCEPASFGVVGAGWQGLSDSVLAAVDEAVRIVESLVEEITAGSVGHA
jgi:hypothetical protein